MIKARNRHNGSVSTFTPEQWEQVQADPRYSGLFIRENTIEDLPEVKEMRERQAQEALGKKEDTDTVPAASVAETRPKAKASNKSTKPEGDKTGENQPE